MGISKKMENREKRADQFLPLKHVLEHVPLCRLVLHRATLAELLEAHRDRADADAEFLAQFLRRKPLRRVLLQKIVNVLLTHGIPQLTSSSRRNASRFIYLSGEMVISLVEQELKGYRQFHILMFLRSPLEYQQICLCPVPSGYLYKRSTIRAATMFKRKRHPPTESVSVPAVGSVSRQTIETRLVQLSRADFSHARAYGEDSLRASSFPEWFNAAQGLQDPDQIRNAIYYGFQPLYDMLIRGDRQLDGQRPEAVRILEDIMDMGVAFLTGYYTGEPDVRSFQERMHAVESRIPAVERVSYRTKFRNVDYNGIYPAGIALFLRRFLENVLEGTLETPDYIVGCACGSSEIAMPLAGLLGTNVGFIRRSKRRGDSLSRVVSEHVGVLREKARGKTVACIDDYVCTGASMRIVIEKIADYGASSIVGASVNCTGNDHLHHETRERKFNTYRLR